jgi:hypothetical protein
MLLITSTNRGCFSSSLQQIWGSCFGLLQMRAPASMRAWARGSRFSPSPHWPKAWRRRVRLVGAAWPRACVEPCASASDEKRDRSICPGKLFEPNRALALQSPPVELVQRASIGQDIDAAKQQRVWDREARLALPDMSQDLGTQETTSVRADFLVADAVRRNQSPISLSSPAAENSLASANLSGNLPGSGFFGTHHSRSRGKRERSVTTSSPWRRRRAFSAQKARSLARRRAGTHVKRTRRAREANEAPM